MNRLHNTRCYLIGSMQNDPNGADWRAYATRRLSRIGVTVFDPYHKPFINEIREDDAARVRLKRWMAAGQFKRVAAHMKHVRSDDLRLCDISDFFLVRIDPKIASWGSAEELFWANRCRKPLFVAVNGGKRKTPLWLMGTLPDHYFYDSISDALAMIERIDVGKREIDSGRWRLLREEYR